MATHLVANAWRSIWKLKYSMPHSSNIFLNRYCNVRVDIKSLSEILGHSSIQMTMSLYVHPSIQQKKYFFKPVLQCAGIYPWASDTCNNGPRLPLPLFRQHFIQRWRNGNLLSVSCAMRGNGMTAKYRFRTCR